MRKFLLTTFFLLATGTAYAQETAVPAETASQTAAATATNGSKGTMEGESRITASGGEELPEEGPVYEQKKFAVLQTLDKLTARTHNVTLPVGQPSAVGPLFIDVKTCQKTLPTEKPESVAFLQVWEAKPKSKAKGADQSEGGGSQWVFSGWMFASSPALSAMNHPVYDVWVKDCTDKADSKSEK